MKKLEEVLSSVKFVFVLLFSLSTLSATYWFIYMLLYCGVPDGPGGLSRWWDVASQPLSMGLSALVWALLAPLPDQKTVSGYHITMRDFAELFRCLAIVAAVWGTIFGFAFTLGILVFGLSVGFSSFILVLCLQFYFRVRDRVPK